MRTTGILNDLLSRVTEVGRGLTGPEAAKRSLTDRCAALLSGQGEATGLALAREIFDGFAALETEEKRAFFLEVSQRFGVDEAALSAACDTWRASGTSDAARAMHFASEPGSQELIRRLNRAPGGTRDLVAMRSALLRVLPEEPEIKTLDDDFRHLLGSWFNRGFLELRRIDWSTPAEILEKIIAYEAVHAINGWEELRRRVAAPDRRLYAFFHPALRSDPLIFVEVALAKDMPAAIGPILAEQRKTLNPRTATTAVFYSISNCQEGLRGVSFGSFLIKQVVEELRQEFEGLKTFVTLSPVPGLRRWAMAEPADALTPKQREAVQALEENSLDKEAQASLPGIAARYLVQGRHSGGAPLDPVARFHLGNGARLERINAGGDTSARGMENSWGTMINYLYDLGTIERNHENFASSGEVIASPAVRRLLKAS